MNEKNLRGSGGSCRIHQEKSCRKRISVCERKLLHRLKKKNWKRGGMTSWKEGGPHGSFAFRTVITSESCKGALELSKERGREFRGEAGLGYDLSGNTRAGNFNLAGVGTGTKVTLLKKNIASPHLS